MSKFAEYLGILELTVGNTTLRLKPRKGDNLELMNIFKKNKDNEAQFSKEIYDFLCKIIARDELEAESDREAMEMFIEFNLNELIKQIMIAFRWTNKEDLAKLEADALKKQGN